MLPGRRVLLCGGTGSHGAALEDAWVWEPAAEGGGGQWRSETAAAAQGRVPWRGCAGLALVMWRGAAYLLSAESALRASGRGSAAAYDAAAHRNSWHQT